jgi:hypothetical protein
VEKPAFILPATLPEDVAKLSPLLVIQLPNEVGIVFQWGREAAWAFPRRVFVGSHVEAQPPTDVPSFQYRRMPAGVWLSVEEPG